MKKMFLVMTFVVFTNVFVFAQKSDFEKNEYYVGYSNQQVNEGQRNSYNGFEISYVRNVHRYFGAKADFSAAYFRKSGVSGNISFRETGAVYNFLAGVQAKDNSSKARLKPFGHILVGMGKVSDSFVCSNCSLSSKRSEIGFAGAVGGGFDLKLKDRLNLRAIQVDYNPMYIDSRLNNNIRLGVGIKF